MPESIMVADWITSVATVVLAIITVIYVCLTYKILTETRRQVALTQNPIVTILPEENVEGEEAKFNLDLVNTGVTDVYDIRIYEDYFGCLTPPQGPTTFHKFGVMIMAPNTHIPSLKQGEKCAFKLEFHEIYKEMAAFWQSDIKAFKMTIVRLLVKYKRSGDGKEFRTYKAYIIALGGSLLLDHDERGITMPVGPSYSQIKQVLGVA
jgi:hypothetical protein